MALSTAGIRRAQRRGVLLLGPAFVAAIAYVDPGNVAANLTAGSRYGYLLLWVLVVANAMAVLVQYQSAKLGLVTGRVAARACSGPRLASALAARVLGAGGARRRRDRPRGGRRRGDRAEPAVRGPAGRSAASSSARCRWRCSATQNRYGQRQFECVVVGLLAVITARLPRRARRQPARRARRAVRARAAVRRRRLGAARREHARRDGHAARDLRALRPRPRPARPSARRRRRCDGCCARPAGTSASRSSSRGSSTSGCCCSPRPACAACAGTDTIEGAYDAIVAALGLGIGVVFAIGLLASGLASTSVGRLRGRDDHGGPAAPPRAARCVRRVVTLIPGGGAPRARRRPDLDAGAQPGGAELRHPVRGDPPGGAHPLARRDGRRAHGPAPARASWSVVTLVVALNLTLLTLLLTG